MPIDVPNTEDTNRIVHDRHPGFSPGVLNGFSLGNVCGFGEVEEMLDDAKLVGCFLSLHLSTIVITCYIIKEKIGKN